MVGMAFSYVPVVMSVARCRQYYKFWQILLLSLLRLWEDLNLERSCWDWVVDALVVLDQLLERAENADKRKLFLRFYWNFYNFLTRSVEP